MNSTGTGSYTREEQRIPLSTGVLVRPLTREAVFGRVRDVSRNSIYLYTEYQPDANEAADIDLVLAGSNSQLSIKAPAMVVRRDDQGVAFRFTTPLEWWPVLQLFSTALVTRQ